jgi:formylglycine-generating enzyme required for sulfatase activity
MRKSHSEGRMGLFEVLSACCGGVSLYEADAFAKWRACRLPTEAEWESIASQDREQGNFLDTGRLPPANASGAPNIEQLYGDCWEWTVTSYTRYPGYKSLPGALGEYNVKFMSGQMIMRAGRA